MPLSNIRLEVEYCIDAGHAQQELELLMRAVIESDKAYEAQLAGEAGPLEAQRPHMVLELMRDEDGKEAHGDFAWKGRLSTEVG